MQQQSGFTLFEMLLAIALLALFFGGVVLSIAPSQETRLDAAATRVKTALDTARSLSMRDADYYGIKINPLTQQYTVYKADVSSDPVSIASIATNPLSKQPYQAVLGSNTATRGIVFDASSASFTFANIGAKNDLLFNQQGRPVWLTISSGQSHRLLQGSVVLSGAEQQRFVIVDNITGQSELQ